MTIMSEFGCDLQLLSKLLNPQKEDESDEDVPVSQSKYLSPADISGPNKEEPIKKETKETPKKIEDIEQYFEETEVFNSKCDWKKTPKWDVSYRQQVSPSDVFLQMSGKTNATASCENMIIKVELPGESRHNIDLKVLKTSLELTSPNFYLAIPLPQPVNPQLGNAKFDTDLQSLIITLVMDREFDFVNL